MARRSDKSNQSNTNNQQTNSPDLLSSFSQSVDRFDASTTSFSKSYDDNTTKLIKSMEDLTRAFKSEVELFNKNNKRSNEDQVKQDKASLEALDNKLAEATKDFDKRATSRTQTFGKTMKQVADYAVNKLTTAFESVVSNYNAKFTEITVRMDQTASEYTKMLQDSTDWIKGNNFFKADLRTQFSQIDWTSSLSEALSTGLRGEYAKNMAYQSMISNKLLPQLTTTTKAYTRMSKLMGDQFTQTITAIGKYTEQVYGAEGLEDNQLNELIESSYREIANSIAERGGTAEDFDRIMSNYIGTYQQYANQYGSEYATQLLSDYKDYLTGEAITGNNIVSLVAGGNAGLLAGDSTQISDTTFSDFAKAYAGYYSQYAGQSWMATYAGLGNYNTYLDQRIGDYYGQALKSWETYLGDFNAGDQYESLLKDLESGKYQSITDQQIKWNENLVANTADIAAKLLPDTIGMLRLVQGIIATWFTSWVARNTLGGSNGSGNLLGNMVKGTTGPYGGSGFFGIAGDQATKLLQTSIKTGSLTQGISESAALGKSALSGLGTAAGYAGILGGLIMGGVDTGKAVSHAKASGEDILSAGVQGFFTGSSSAGMSAEEKAAYYAQNGTFSVSDMLKNAGKYALIGGGVGTLTGGPLGTVVGSVVGGIGGAVTNAIDQQIEAANYKRLKKASDEASASLEALNTTSDTLNQAFNDSTNGQQALDIVLNETSRNTSEYSNALKQLKQLYPQYINNTSDVTTLTKEQTAAIEANIKQQKDQAVAEATSTATGTDIDTSSYKLGYNTSYDFAQAMQSGTITDPDQWVKDYAETHKLDESTVRQQLGTSFGESVVNQFTGNGGLKFDTGGKTNWKTYDYSGYISSKDAERQNYYTNEWVNKIQGQYVNLLTTYANNTTGQYDSDLKMQYDSLIEDITTYRSKLGGSNTLIDKFNTDWSVWKSELQPIAEYLDESKTFPSFRKGIDRTSEGLAYLHKDEAVLTATTAKQLRELSEGNSISAYVNDMYSTTATATPSISSLDLTSIANTIASAISQQTSELVEYLKEIIGYISPTGTNRSFDPNLVSYRGVS